jgi:coenzyme F420 hydrogenase subunit beta
MPAKLAVLEPTPTPAHLNRAAASRHPANPLRIFSRRIRTIGDVVDWGLCTGCGACAYFCDKNAVTLTNIPAVGIRPQFTAPDCAACTACLAVCPGYSVDAEPANESAARESDRGFGACLQIWEGFACDPEIRFNASSGGLLSALALYCLEHEGMRFVLHTGADPTKPWENRTVRSATRTEILSRTGSRYAPASPCDGLRSIEDSEGPCVFIGKPCDVAAVSELRRRRPELDRNLGLVLTFFCAGTPSTEGTFRLLESMSVDPTQVQSIRYRGRGWPGRFTVRWGQSPERSLSYAESWGVLTGYRPWRCHLCPDGLGQTADISCGDAWERFSGEPDPGRSIVIVRTERGREILRRAIQARYVELELVTAETVIAAQRNLLGRRKEIFGRLLAMRLLLIPAPRFRGFFLFRSWFGLPVVAKLRSLAGTWKRVVSRGLWHKRSLFQ